MSLSSLPAEIQLNILELHELDRSGKSLGNLAFTNKQFFNTVRKEVECKILVLHKGPRGLDIHEVAHYRVMLRKLSSLLFKCFLRSEFPDAPACLTSLDEFQDDLCPILGHLDTGLLFLMSCLNA
jgi:hypothetical protein